LFRVVVVSSMAGVEEGEAGGEEGNGEEEHRDYGAAQPIEAVQGAWVCAPCDAELDHRSTRSFWEQPPFFLAKIPGTYCLVSIISVYPWVSKHLAYLLIPTCNVIRKVTPITHFHCRRGTSGGH
jgi:hypothetical protein